MNRSTFALFLLLAMFLTLSGRPAEGASPPGVTPVTNVEGIWEYRLDNGLRVLLFPDPSKQTVTVNITYLVGSRHENYGETGMAHLLEHLLFKGSSGHRDIPQEQTAHGCRPNGSTWLDRTNYFETFNATEENLIWALDLEADRMVNSFIDHKDLDSEMTVVRNEFEVGENDPQGVLEERVLSCAYLWHNYGKSTIGSRSDIENVPIERLQAFYRTWYQPDNAILVVSGKCDPEKTLGLITQKFGAIPRPARTLPSIYTVEPAQDGERTVTLKRVGDIQAIRLAYHIPAGSHPDFPACEILAKILGDTPSGRLYKTLVETQLVSRVSSWAMQMHDPGILFLNAELSREGRMEEAREAMIRCAEAAGAEAPTSEELQRARESLLSDWERGMRNTERAAIGLSEWASMGDWRLIFLHRDRLKAVTSEDVQRVAAAYLRPANRTVGIYLPTDKPDRVSIPATPDLTSQLAGFQGGQGPTEGEEFDAAPEKIEPMIARRQLACGMKLILLSKKTRGATVRGSMSFHLGDETTLRDRLVISGLTGDMLMRGTAKHTRQQIKDELDRQRADVRIGGGGAGVWGSFEVSIEHLNETLELIAEILRDPSFPESEFELLRQERLTELEESRKDPRQISMTKLQRHLRPYAQGDPRYLATPEEEIAELKSVTLASVRQFYKELYGASAAEFSLLGEIDVARAGDLVSRLFGDWKSETPYARIPEPYREIAALDERIETPDKESAVFNAGLRLNISDEDKDYPALVLGDFMTGGGFLNSRLATRIRRTEGLSYGVRSFFRGDKWDKNSAWGAFAIYAPQNSERLLIAFKEELNKIMQDGFGDSEIEEAKSGWLQQRKVARSQDRDLARMLTELEYQGRTLAWQADLESKIAVLSKDDILQAMRRQIDVKKISMVQAGDFAGAAKAGGVEKSDTPKNGAPERGARTERKG